MKNNRLIVPVCIATIFFLSCDTNNGKCGSSKIEELVLPKVNTILKLPAYVVIDTVRYGDSDNIFHSEVMSLDSSLLLLAGIKSYAKNQEAMPDIVLKMAMQKTQIESGQDSMKLLVEKYKNIDTTKVGYLKYLDVKRNRYEGRIFFYQDLMFVDIWIFENCADCRVYMNSEIDCIFENIEVERKELL